MDKRTAPWPDYEGNPIREGDRICHPEGDQGDVYRLPDIEDPASMLADRLERTGSRCA
jgi:hypothetical protein